MGRGRFNSKNFHIQSEVLRHIFAKVLFTESIWLNQFVELGTSGMRFQMGTRVIILEMS